MRYSQYTIHMKIQEQNKKEHKRLEHERTHEQ